MFLGQQRVAGAEGELVMPLVGAGGRDRRRQVRVGALHRQAGRGPARVGLVGGFDAGDVQRAVDLVVVIDVVGDAAIAVHPRDFGLQRGADADIARQVAADAEAAVRVAVADRAVGGLGRHAVGAVLELERIAVLVEGGALQRAGADQAVLGVLIGLGVLAIEILRRAVVGDAAIDQRRGGVPVAAARRVLAEAAGGHALLLVVLGADLDVQAVVQEGLAAGDLQQELLVVAVGRDARRDIGLEAFEALVGDEVDDAADRVGAVGGRRAAGHHVDALDQQLREQADVGNARDVGRNHALAVQQGQGPDGAQAAQRERAQALLAARGAERAGGRARRALQGRQLRDGREDVRLGVALQVGLAQGLGRRGRGEAAGPDPRAGDDDLGQGRGVRPPALPGPAPSGRWRRRPSRSMRRRSSRTKRSKGRPPAPRPTPLILLLPLSLSPSTMAWEGTCQTKAGKPLRPWS
jgi:hypothetical protein